jgi:tRNA uridine 5-carbamoylmethylation protein Kti12
MKLIFIYGPPAAGKLTVANELAKLTNFKIYDNHQLLDGLSRLFPFNDEKLSQVRMVLARKIRIEIFSQCAQSGVNCVTTFGQAGEKYFDFYRDIKSNVEKFGGEVLFVQLKPSHEALLERVVSDSRKGAKIDNRDFLKDKLAREPQIFDLFPDVKHLSIDNSTLEPSIVAGKICEYYSL